MHIYFWITAHATVIENERVEYCNLWQWILSYIHYGYAADLRVERDKYVH
jgi:hypothetical protein